MLVTYTVVWKMTWYADVAAYFSIMQKFKNGEMERFKTFYRGWEGKQATCEGK